MFFSLCITHVGIYFQMLIGTDFSEVKINMYILEYSEKSFSAVPSVLHKIIKKLIKIVNFFVKVYIDVSREKNR